MEKEVFLSRLLKSKKHPVLANKRTPAQKAADTLTTYMGSWIFIIIFLAFMLIWILLNSYFLIRYQSGKPWDPYPFILLNLALSCLAAIQAPIILMSQNREAQKDRLRAQYDYAVNKKAEKEIQELRIQLNRIETKLK